MGNAKKRCRYAWLMLLPAFAVSAVDNALQAGKAYLDAGDFEEAVSTLEAEHARSPSLQSSRLLGMAYYHVGDYTRAKPLLSQVAAADRGDNEVRLQLVDIAFGERRFAAIGPALERLREDFPDDAGVWERQGYLFLHLGRYADAAQAFSQSLELDPSQAPRLAIDVVPLYLKLGESAKAKVLLLEILNEYPNAFEADYLRMLLEHVQSTAAKPERKLRYLAQLGMVRESDNYLLVGSTDPAPGSQAGWTPSSDSRNVFTARLFTSYPLNVGRGLFGDVFLYRSEHDHLSQYDQEMHKIELGYSKRRAQRDYRLVYAFSQIDLDQHFYSDSHRISPELSIRLNKEQVVGGALVLQRNDYLEAASPAEQRSGYLQGADLHWRSTFAKQRGLVNLGLARQNNLSDGDNWDYHESQLSAYVNYRPATSWNLFAGGKWTRRQFEHEHDVYQQIRLDRTSQWHMRLSYWPTPQWELSAQGTWVDTSSTISLYTYERRILGLGVKWRH